MSEQLLVILKGLPGSGKSMWAAAWRAVDPQRREVVNRDQTRVELFGLESGLTDEQEAVVTDIESFRADRALGSGRSVLVDATNLESAHRGAWVEMAGRWGVRPVIVVMGTPLEECLRRNAARGAAGGRMVPAEVIREMYEAM